MLLLLFEVRRGKNFGELHEDQRTLFAFLQAELDLAAILYTMASSPPNAERRLSILDKVRTALKSVRRFEGRLVDLNEREQIGRGVERLEQLMADSENSNW